MTDVIQESPPRADKVPVPRIATVDGKKPRTGPAHEPFERQKMVRWLAPGQLAVTAVRALLSGTFGAYADRREVQAALHQHDGEGGDPATAGGRIFPYVDVKDANGDFWFDFVADLGDGFDPTYSVAWLLARGQLPAPAADVTVGVDAAGKAVTEDGAAAAVGDPTRRGHVLVMGGDQVYPTASRDEYQNRLSGPYEAALPYLPDSERPDLFAIPGNHDWYDGLTSFIRLFCQARGLGAWQTRQSRSYWALRLPHRWWVLGLDVQLQSDIDRPQLDYFHAVAERMQPGDRVILCTPEPAWVHTRCEHGAFDNLAYFERTVLARAKAELALTLTGDLHHYARYSIGDGEAARHKITAGGGGAYLLGTQLLPDTLDLHTPAAQGDEWANDQEGKTETWTRADSLYPSLGESVVMKGRAFSLWYKNPSFALLLGIVYLVFGWLLESGSRMGGKEGSFRTILRISDPIADFGPVWRQFTQVMHYSPVLLAFVVMIVGAMIGFAAPDVERSSLLLRYPALRTVMRVVVGGAHGAAHVVLAFILAWLWAKASGPIHVDGGAVVTALAGFGNGLLLLAGRVVAGGLAGSLLFALFLLPLVNYNEAFSAQHLETHKNFVRLRIGADGRLTVWSYGVDKPGRWEFHPNAPEGQAFYDATRPPRLRLIEQPITLAAPSSDAPVAPDDGIDTLVIQGSARTQPSS